MQIKEIKDILIEGEKPKNVKINDQDKLKESMKIKNKLEKKK
jgi:hypothetical protein